MPKVRAADVERMEGQNPETDTECLTHLRPFEGCTRCSKAFCRSCIQFPMENRPGLCGECGRRDYENELASDLFEQYPEEPLYDTEADSSIGDPPGHYETPGDN